MFVSITLSSYDARELKFQRLLPGYMLNILYLYCKTEVPTAGLHLRATPGRNIQKLIKVYCVVA